MSTTTPRTIALVASAVGLLCACGIPLPSPVPPPPPDMVAASAENIIRQPTVQDPTQRFTMTFQSLVDFPISIGPPKLINGDPAFTLSTTCQPTLAARSTCTVNVDATNTTTKPLIELVALKVNRPDRFEVHTVRLYLRPAKTR